MFFSIAVIITLAWAHLTHLDHGKFPPCSILSLEARRLLISHFLVAPLPSPRPTGSQNIVFMTRSRSAVTFLYPCTKSLCHAQVLLQPNGTSPSPQYTAFPHQMSPPYPCSQEAQPLNNIFNVTSSRKCPQLFQDRLVLDSTTFCTNLQQHRQHIWGGCVHR